MFLTKNWDFHPKTNQTLSCWNLFCTSSPPINTYKTTNCVSSYCALTRHQQFRSAHRSMSRGSTELTRSRGHSVDGSHGRPQEGWGHLPPPGIWKRWRHMLSRKMVDFFFGAPKKSTFIGFRGLPPLVNFLRRPWRKPFLQPMRYGRVSHADYYRVHQTVRYDVVAFSVQLETCDSVTHIVHGDQELPRL